MSWSTDLRGLPHLVSRPGVLLLVCPPDGDEPESSVPLPSNATVRTIERALHAMGWSRTAARRDAGIIRLRTVEIA